MLARDLPHSLRNMFYIPLTRNPRCCGTKAGNQLKLLVTENKVKFTGSLHLLPCFVYSAMQEAQKPYTCQNPKPCTLNPKPETLLPSKACRVRPATSPGPGERAVGRSFGVF